MPIAFYRNRQPDPYTGAAGDATFPNYIFLATYGYRFGVKKSSAGTALPCATEDGAGKDPLVKDPQ